MLVSDLESVGERLNELMFDVLREAARERVDRPVADKELMKAQRAVEKAINILRGLDD